MRLEFPSRRKDAYGFLEKTFPLQQLARQNAVALSIVYTTRPLNLGTSRVRWSFQSPLCASVDNQFAP